jgi:hypothetical protein
MQRARINYQRLVQAIVDKSDGNQTKAAITLRTSQPTISRWIKGTQVPEKMHHDIIVAHAREMGIINAAEPTEGNIVPIVGYVQAGGETILYSEGQGPFGEAGMPPRGATEYTVAVVVRGDSMPGIAQEGWLLYYDSRHEPPTEGLYGKLCVIGLTDGRIVVKKLLQGSRAGLYHLISSRGDPIFDQAVNWAAKINWIEPQ